MLGSLPVVVREQWPWRPRFARVNGWRMHYIDEGRGDPVVLLHGNPTWGFLYRELIAPLTRSTADCTRHGGFWAIGQANPRACA